METLWVCDLRGGVPWSFRGAGASCRGLPQAWRKQVSTWRAGPTEALLAGAWGERSGGAGRSDRPRGLAREGEGASGGLLRVGASHSVKRGQLSQGS